ncbi:NUDIX hydrolase [Gloeocapsopsis dulcis]|uniref:NUDIX hydrolase n=1 Tax=Gloeocapsopsis dulcis AAB1 = 1H9 TaxID=1433147 RepID=A0A6N8FWR7_9CHRO|nr:NUDIX hydrolase [Gloeocapsopsis dulcis]MUL37391.1 NUDIX hydrolase [Gloeocapsopsis dulcis AAB1 = 1H9]WNN87368.1 NUDIX hydrolase [Gloeocapsopsis dulcis]
MNDQKIHVAIAILYCQNQFLMQLRDNIPGILYPGHWGLFGGHIERGEVPEVAVIRELQEEISYTPPVILNFGCYNDSKVVRHVYHAPLTVELDRLVLNEGWDMGLLTPQQILHGECYSAKAGEYKPLGTPHQKILLDFLKLKPYS